RDGLLRVRHGQEVVEVERACAAPREMVGEPWRVEAHDEIFQLREVVAIEGLYRSDRERDSVRDDAVGGSKALEVRERRTAVDEEVLADDLEPVHRRALPEDLRVVRRPQPDP